MEKHPAASVLNTSTIDFFVKDRIASQEVSVQCCPTENMIAVSLIKPLQGAVFKKFRDQVMNVDPTTSSLQDHRSVLENVEKESPDYSEGTEWIHVTKKKHSKATLLAKKESPTRVPK